MRPSYCNGIQINANLQGNEFALLFYQEYLTANDKGEGVPVREEVASIVSNQACAIALRDALTEAIDKVNEYAEKHDEQPG